MLSPVTIKIEARIHTHWGTAGIAACIYTPITRYAIMGSRT